jgi:transcriptional regulator with XRE-family HTH domain
MIKMITSHDDLADFIKAKRLERGLTQAQVAGALGMSTCYFSFIETNRKRISLNRFFAILRVLDVKLKYRLAQTSTAQAERANHDTE